MKKAISLILVLFLISSFSVGCGQKAGDSASQNSTTESQAAVTTKSESTVATQREATQAELKVFMTLPRFKDQFDKYFEQFKAKEKAEKNIDVKINLEMPNSDQAEQILKTRLASNDAPDLFNIHANNIATYYDPGYMADLSDQPFVSSLFENVKNIVTYKGKVVALPMESTSWGYLYNQKIFSDLAITPPQTLDEMKAVVEKLKAKKITPFMLAFQESWIPQLMMALSLGGTVNSRNPDFVDKMNKGEGSYNDVASVFDIIDVILQNGTDKPFEVGSAAGSSDFANGKAAMWVQGPWMSESILKANDDFKLGVAPLPVSNDPKGTMINLSVSTTVALSANTKYKEAAGDLLNYFLDAKDSSALYEQLQFNPVASFHNYSTFAWVDEASKYVSAGKAYKDLSLPQAVTDETAKMLQSYYAKEVTKDEIIKALDKAWADSLKTKK
jgi:ABC-type sugar transport system, periplasmic component